MSAVEQLKILFDDKKGLDFEKMASEIYEIFETVENEI
jgi:hypothetical protein